jgi:hypothetical protein
MAGTKSFRGTMRGVGDAYRFWSGTNRPSLDSCWLWTRSVGSHGYGQVTFRGKPATAHRVSWEIHNGPVPDGLDVLHRCDVRRCCNPAHLFVGTARDNMRDMHSKGRANNPHKLSEDDVLNMRTVYAFGGRIVDLAAAYGVTPATASEAIKGTTWKGLP